jgi:tetratricopeptide (TPR) repeat protein
MTIVGREAEFAVLDRAVQALVGGASPMVEIVGPSGIGRSTLLWYAVSAARRAGAVALTALGDIYPAHDEHGVVTQLMEHLDRRATGLVAIAALLELAATTPVLVAVDDAHQLDQRSRTWLAGLAGRADGVPLMIVVVTDGVHTVLDGADVLAPHPLAIEPITELAAAASGAPVDTEFAEAVERCTSGLPAMLRGVLDRCVAGGLAPTAADAKTVEYLADDVGGDRVVRIMRTLPAEAAALARAIAVCGPRFDFVLMCALARLRHLSSAGALDLLVGAGLVTADEPPELAAGVTAAGVLEGMSPSARQDLHRRAARLGHRSAVDATEVARILASAPPLGTPWVVPLLRTVARREVERGKPCLAIRHLERALRERLEPATRAEVVLALATTESIHSPEIADLRLARMLLEPQPAECAEPRRAAADQLFARGDAALIRRTFGAIGESAAEWAGLTALYWVADDAPVEAPEFGLFEVPELVVAPGEPGRAGPAALICAMRGVDAELATSLARTALADPLSMLMSRVSASFALMLADEVEDATAGLDGVLVEARRRGLTAVAGRALLNRAAVRTAEGRLDDAAADLEQATAELPQANWHPDVRPLLIAATVLVRLARGEIDLAEEAAARLPDDELGLGYARTWFLFARGVLAAMCGNAAAAVEDLEETGRRLRARQALNPALVPWRSIAARAWRTLGHLDRATALSTEDLMFAERWGTRSAVARAHLTCAEVSGEDEHLRKAVQLLQGPSHPLLRAGALLDLAEAVGPGPGAPLVREAGTIAVACRAAPLITRARGLGWMPGV